MARSYEIMDVNLKAVTESASTLIDVCVDYPFGRARKSGCNNQVSNMFLIMSNAWLSMLACRLLYIHYLSAQ